MKKLAITVSILIGLRNAGYSQKWLRELDTVHTSFFAVQNAFYQNFHAERQQNAELVTQFLGLKNGKKNRLAVQRNIEPGETDHDYIRFKRWEYYWQPRVDKKGQFPSADVLVEASRAANALKLPNTDTTSTANQQWKFLGPTSSVGNLQRYVGVGRASCVAFHPTNSRTMWVGTPAGGLWKTTDQAATWSTSTDTLPVLGISDIVIDPSDTNNMYIATGDGESAYNISTGNMGGDTKSIGILKSADGGKTWAPTDLSWQVIGQNLIHKLIIDPANPQVLLAASSNGIWRTEDGGKKWDPILSGWFTDIVFHPTEHMTAYATSFGYQGQAQIFRSIDNGKSWDPSPLETRLNRIKLAVTPALPDLVAAVCVDTLISDSDGGNLKGIWLSYNKGITFKEIFFGSLSINLLNSTFNGSGCCGQGMYDLSFAINPKNAGEMLLGGVNTYKSTDTGRSWTINNFWSDEKSQNPNSIQVVHADKHVIAFHPRDGGVIFECNDGGIYRSADDGMSWTDLTSGMGISEIYRLSASVKNKDNVICGLQDNGSKQYIAGQWVNRVGGDGMECIIDYTDPKIEYHSYYSGAIEKSIDGGVSWDPIVGTGDTVGVHATGMWVTPYVIHPTDHNRLLVGKDQVYQTNNGGTSWHPISNIRDTSGKIRSIAYAPSLPATIYIGFDHRLYRTTNGGKRWDRVFEIDTAVISYIAVSPTDPKHLWIGISGYAPGIKMLESTKGFDTFENTSGNLPNVPVNCIAYSKSSPEGLFIGTDLGVYFLDFRNPSKNWVRYGHGLPNVVVNDLQITPDGKLWAATFGRGMWVLDLGEKNHQMVLPQ